VVPDIKVAGQGEKGQTLFEAKIGTLEKAPDALWEFKIPPGAIPETTMTAAPTRRVNTPTYRMQAPQILVPQAKNILLQMEDLATTMEEVSGRTRRAEATIITIKVGRGGAAATNSGKHMRNGSKFFYGDLPVLRHGFAHEMAHNHNFNHGGLMETVVEVSRSGGLEADQISHQPGKWLFIDRMNGINRPEKPYQNVGLYLYCYAQGREPFLRFMLKYEPPVRKQLEKLGFTEDEFTTALLGLALEQDMTKICRNYGLKFTPARVEYATRVIRETQHLQ
jgi:hypothetical protein